MLAPTAHPICRQSLSHWNGMMPCPSSESSLLHLQSNQEKGCHLPIRMWVCVCLHTSQALATPVTRQQLPYSYFAPEARRPLSVKGTVALDATTDLEEAKSMSDRFTNGMLISSCSSVAANGTKLCPGCCCPYLEWSTFHLPMDDGAMQCTQDGRTGPPPPCCLVAACHNCSRTKNAINVQLCRTMSKPGM